jgi:hypothetical protein
MIQFSEDSDPCQHPSSPMHGLKQTGVFMKNVRVIASLWAMAHPRSSIHAAF